MSRPRAVFFCSCPITHEQLMVHDMMPNTFFQQFGCEPTAQVNPSTNLLVLFYPQRRACLPRNLSVICFSGLDFSLAMCIQLNKKHCPSLQSLLIALLQKGCLPTKVHRCCNAPRWNIWKLVSNRCKWDARVWFQHLASLCKGWGVEFSC